ncbi:MAG: hypothetical protein ACOCVN_02615 [bacterium]
MSRLQIIWNELSEMISENQVLNLFETTQSRIIDSLKTVQKNINELNTN